MQKLETIKQDIEKLKADHSELLDLDQKYKCITHNPSFDLETAKQKTIKVIQKYESLKPDQLAIIKQYESLNKEFKELKKASQKEDKPQAPKKSREDMTEIEQIIDDMNKLNPKLSGWPQLKQKYLSMIKLDGFSFETANEKQKSLIAKYNELKPIREQVKALKEKKELLKSIKETQQAKRPLAVQKVKLPPRQTKQKNFNKEKYNHNRSFTAGFFRQEVQSGVFAKKR